MRVHIVTIPVFLLLISGSVSSKAQNHGELGQTFLSKLSRIFKEASLERVLTPNEEEPILVNILHTLWPNLTSIDPWDLEDGTDSYDNLFLAGHHTSTDNDMTGFSTITDALWLAAPPGFIELTFQVDLPSLHIAGGYDSGISFLKNLVHFSGSGKHNFNLENLFGTLGITLYATETPSLEITRLLVDAGFDRLEFQFENSEVNCSPANWDEINQDIRIFFEIYWPVVRDRVVPTLQAIINEVIKDCNINDLLEGNFDCITGGEPDPIPDLYNFLLEEFLKPVVPRLLEITGRVGYVNPCDDHDVPTTPPVTPSTTHATPPSSTPSGFVSTTPSGGARTTPFTTLMPLWLALMVVVVKSFQIWSQ